MSHYSTVSSIEDFSISSNAPLLAYVNGSYIQKISRGGWGLVLVNQNNQSFHASGVKTHVTSNFMYLCGILHMIELVQKKKARNCAIKLFTNSKYIRCGFENVRTWKRHHWQTADKKQVKHWQTWESILKTMSKHKIESVWLPNEALDPVHFDSRCLAGHAMRTTH